MTAPSHPAPVHAPLFHATVAAICESLITGMSVGDAAPAATGPVDFAPTAQFVLQQCGRMPDFLRLPLRVLTLLFACQSVLLTGTRFHRLPLAARARHLAAWKQSRLGFRRDFVRFYESLVVLGWYSLRKEA